MLPYALPLEQQSLLAPILNQSHRHYHNIIHVNDCLAELYKWYDQNRGTEYDQHLTYAIWYHDIVYNPYAPTPLNEEQSAKLFEHVVEAYEYNQDFTNYGMIATVKEIIRWTAYHVVTNNFEICDTALVPDVAHLMMDIDLAQMGHSLATFSKNSLNIRQEYHRTSDMDVVRGRLKFFKELNKRDTFYYTEFFRDLYHEQSKKNVKTEIKVLEECVERNEAIYYLDHLLEHTVDQ